MYVHSYYLLNLCSSVLHPLKKPAWIYYSFNGIAFSLSCVMPFGLLVTCNQLLLDSLKGGKMLKQGRDTQCCTGPEKPPLRCCREESCPRTLREFPVEGPLPTADMPCWGSARTPRLDLGPHSPSLDWNPQGISLLSRFSSSSTGILTMPIQMRWLVETVPAS